MKLSNIILVVVSVSTSFADDLPRDYQHLRKARERKIEDINSRYVKALEKLKKKYTQQGNLEIALKINKEIKSYSKNPSKLEDTAGSVKLGDALVTLQQGVHRSVGKGKYHKGGIYSITMKDGGNGRHWTMKFKLTTKGGGDWFLKRLDLGDAWNGLDPLTDKGDGVLSGGAFTLKFTNKQ